MLCGKAVTFTALACSLSLNLTDSSPVFIMTTTTSLFGVMKPIFSRVVPTVSVWILTEPRGTYLLQNGILVYVCMCICMYVCMCICMYVRIYVCMYVYMYICTYVCMYVRMYARIYICMYVCMYVCTYVYSCMYVCMYVCMYICMYVRMYVCMYVCIMYVCLHVRTDILPNLSYIVIKHLWI